MEARHATMIRFPDGAGSVGIPKTNGDNRARLNARAEIRRRGLHWPLDGPARTTRVAKGTLARLEGDLAELTGPVTVTAIAELRRAKGTPVGNEVNLREQLAALGYREIDRRVGGRGGRPQVVYGKPADDADAAEAPGPFREQPQAPLVEQVAVRENRMRDATETVPAAALDARWSVRWAEIDRKYADRDTKRMGDYKATANGTVVLTRHTAFGPAADEELDPDRAERILDEVLAETPQFGGGSTERYMREVIAEARRIQTMRRSAGLDLPVASAEMEPSPVENLPDEPMPPADYPLPPEAQHQPTDDGVDGLLEEASLLEAERDRLRAALATVEAERDSLHGLADEVEVLRAERDRLQTELATWKEGHAAAVVAIREHEKQTRMLVLENEGLREDLERARAAGDALERQLEERNRLIAERLGVSDPRDTDALLEEVIAARRSQPMQIVVPPANDGWEGFTPPPDVNLGQLEQAAKMLGVEYRFQRRAVRPTR